MTKIVQQVTLPVSAMCPFLQVSLPQSASETLIEWVFCHWGNLEVRQLLPGVVSNLVFAAKFHSDAFGTAQ